MHFDSLERRVLFAGLANLDGVIVTLNGTILSLTAPTGSDTVSLHQTGSIFQVDGTAGGFARTTGLFTLPSVTGISVLAGGGAESITALSSNTPTSEVSVPVTLVGGSGNDTLVGGKGNDSILGGSGSDLIDGDAGANTLNGGGGTNTANYSDRTTGVTIDLASGTADSGKTGQGDLLLNMQNAIGGAGNDSIIGNPLGNVLAGNGGNDTIVGGGGDDSIAGNDGTNTLGGGAGNDFISAQNNVTDTLDGGAGTNIGNADPFDLLANIGSNAVLVGPSPIGALAIHAAGPLVGPLTLSTQQNPLPDPEIPNTGAGQLDPSFGDGGDSGGFAQSAFAVFALPGGKTLAVGSVSTPDANNAIALVQYNADGTLDQTFGYRGREVAEMAGLLFLNPVAAAMDAQGRIVVVGSYDHGTGNFLARFNADGSRDNSFGPGGLVIDPNTSSGSNGLEAVAVQPDGKIVAAGYGGAAGTNQFQVNRYNDDGSLDTTFTLPASLASTAAQATSMLVRPNGDVDVALGDDIFSPDTDVDVIAQFLPTGAPDTSFGNGGVLTLGPAGTASVESMALAPDGSILGAGYNIQARNTVVLRVLPDGSGLDSNFGAAGIVQGSVKGEAFTAVQLLANGDIAAAGTLGDPFTPAATADQVEVLDASGNVLQQANLPATVGTNVGLAISASQTITVAYPNPFSLTRFTFTGGVLAPGNSFGTGGTVNTQPLPDGLGKRGTTIDNGGANRDASNDIASAVAQDTSGNSYVAGLTDGQIFVYKFGFSSGRDNTFGVGGAFGQGEFVYQFGLPTTIGNIDVDSTTGDVYVAGTVGNPGSQQAFILRLTPSGTLDSTFGIGGIVSNIFPNNFGANDIAQSGVDVKVNPNTDGAYLLVDGTRPNGSHQMEVLSFLPSGVLDTTFGSGNGVAIAPAPSGPAFLNGVTAGSLALNGTKLDVGGYAADFAVLVQLNANGTADNNFGSTGFTTTTLDNGETPNILKIAVDPASGNIILAASNTTNGSAPEDQSTAVLAFGSNGLTGTGFQGAPVFTNGQLAGIVFPGDGPTFDIITSGDPTMDSLPALSTGTSTVLATEYDETGSAPGGPVLGYEVVDPSLNGTAVAGAVNGTGNTITIAATITSSGNSNVTATIVGNFGLQTSAGTNFVIGNFQGQQSTIQSTGNSYVTAIAAKPNGQIQAIVSDQGGSSSRIQPELLDASGAVILTGAAVTFQANFASANSVILEPDGSFIVGGTVTEQNYSAFFLEKYNADGTIDPTFGLNGQVLTQFADLGIAGIVPEVLIAGPTNAFQAGDYSSLAGIALAPNGEIVVGGSDGDGASNSTFAAALFNADGSQDTSFATGQGAAFEQFPGSFKDQANALTVDSSGNILLAGQTNPGGEAEFAALRLLPDGTLDTSFGNGGFFSLAFGVGGGDASAIAVDGHGRIYLGGTAGSEFSQYAAIVQLTPDGQIDATDGFGASGQLTQVYGASSVVTTLNVLSDGDLLVGGNFVSEVPVAFLEELSNGALDPSFGGLNGDTPGLTSNFLPNVNSLAVQPDGNILVGTSSDYGGFWTIGRVLGHTAGQAQPPAKDIDLNNNIQIIAGAPQVQAVVDTLPDYLAPFFASANTDGTLMLNGGAGDDSIAVSYDSTLGEYIVQQDGASESFDAYTITGVSISGGNGNDSITVDSSVNIPVTIDGGNGNDSLTAGSGEDILRGGNGNDSLTPGGSNNQLLGGNGDDTFFTAAGTSDSVDGGLGSNTAYTNSTDQFKLIQNLLPNATGNTGAMRQAVSVQSAAPAAVAIPAEPTGFGVSTFIVTTTAATGDGSLLQAIENADAGDANINVITFALPAGQADAQGNWVISPTEPLPAITSPVFIDGSSQNGYGNAPVVVIDGSQIGTDISNDDGSSGSSASDGLQISGGGSTVAGLSFVHFNGNGLVLASAGADTVVDNYLGLNPDGSANGNTADGLFIHDTSANLVEGNVISGNAADGVELGSRDDLGNAAPADFLATGNVITGNVIGLDPTATTGAGNGVDGVLIDGAPSNTVSGNVIADNDGDGVDVINQNIVTTVDTDGAFQETLSGSAGTETILGNAIGTNFIGAPSLGNAQDGVFLNDEGSDLITGGNIVAGNGRDGIRITADNEGGDTITGNDIGIDAASDPSFSGAGSLGNAGNGITLLDQVSGVVIGNTDGGANVIAGNAGAGVMVGSVALDNSIRGNSIDANDGLAIDLNASSSPADDATGDGVTANLPAVINSTTDSVSLGGNDLLNAPQLTSASTSEVDGTFIGTPGEQVTLDFYSSPTADPSGFGQGRSFLGSTQVTIPADSTTGVATFSAMLNFPAGTSISATATDAQSRGTSEFSNALAVAGTIVQPGSIQFDSATYTVNGSQSMAVIQIDRVGGSGGAASILLSTSDGSAGAADYQEGFSQTVNFTDGQNTATVDVPITVETEFGPDKTINLSLSDPMTASAGTQQTAVLTIHNVVAEPSVSVADASVTDVTSGTTTLAFDAHLSAPSEFPTTVSFATTDDTAVAGTDYTAPPLNSSVTIPAGQTDAAIDITVIGNARYNTPRDFFLELSAPVNATLSTTQAKGTINTAVAEPSVSVGDASVTASTSTTTTLTFDAHLSAPSGVATVISYTTQDDTAIAGTDYTAATNNTVTIPAGQTDASIKITILADPAYAAPKDFLLKLSSPVNATLANTQAKGTINTGATAPTLSVADATVNDATSGTSNLVFTVTLSGLTQLPTSFSYTTQDGTAVHPGDYTMESGVLTFPANTNGQATQTMTISVPVVGKNISQANKTLKLVLSSPQNGTITRATATGTIAYTFVAPSVVSIAKSSVTDVTTGTTTIVFNLSRTGTAGAASVLVSSTDGTAVNGTDYTFLPTVVTFPAGVSKETLSITVLGHNYYFADRTFTLTLSPQSGATIGTASAVGTIHSGVAAPKVSDQDVSVYNPTTGTTTVMVPVTLSAPDAAAVTLNFKTVNGTAKSGKDYVAASGSITFAPFQTTVYVPVTIDGTSTTSGNLAFTVVLTSTPTGGAKIGTSTATVTIVNTAGQVYIGPDPVTPGQTALFVIGTNANDVIQILPAGATPTTSTTAAATTAGLTVFINGVNRGTFNPSGRLIVHGEGGADKITVDPRVTTEAFLYGDTGNNFITAGGGTTVVEGGTGNDSIIGGAGRDVLVGGGGADTVLGGTGDAVLIAGVTAYDGNLFSLNTIAAEWARTDISFSQRVSDLLSGGGSVLGGKVALNPLTVSSSPIPADSLIGGTGQDLFYLDPLKTKGVGDQASNVKKNDVVIPVL